jgi:cytochrome c oxidase cbb3-type subunit I/II
VAELLPAIVSGNGKVASTQPYTPLELEGRDIYLREGCYNCHSQMIRPLRHETQRYGDPSTLADSQYDHPFQWGSKRTGPDLAREGGKYPHLWHHDHLIDPRKVSPGSNMPAYPGLVTARIDTTNTPAKMSAMRSVGVPYTQAQIDGARAHARQQGEAIAKELADTGATAAPDSEMVAMIAYLQRLGNEPRPVKPADQGISRNP